MQTTTIYETIALIFKLAAVGLAAVAAGRIVDLLLKTAHVTQLTAGGAA